MKITLLLVLSILFNYQELSATECVNWDISKFSNSHSLFIEKIIIENLNIFDTRNTNENLAFHKLANGLHIKTQKQVIQGDLLFQIGEKLEIQKLDETERILRSRDYIKDAEITPYEVCGDMVSVLVKTHDNWTLQPGVSFGSSGGKNKHSFELQEKNFLGLGKNLEFKYRKGYERTEKSIKYYDPALFNSHLQVLLNYQNNSDGKLKYGSIKSPFYSLNTKNSWSIDYLDWTLIHPLYDFGEISGEIGEIKKNYNFSFGRLLTPKESIYQRISFGYTVDESDFFTSEIYPDYTIPEYRNYKYPWVGYEFIKEDFIEKTNFHSMGRVEDVSLGHHLSAQIGQDFNNNSSHFALQYDKGIVFNDNNMIFINAYLNGIHLDNEFINTHFGSQLELYHVQSNDKLLYVSTNFDLGKNLFPEQRQYLGSETGLRGYPFRYFNGDKKFLATVEQRYFYNWYPLKTFKFASAIFLDAGSIWNTSEDREFHANLGVGFRLIPTRTSGGQVIHFDVSTPLESTNGLDTLQFQITTKKSF
ncbi:MAG TPA: BamA/TamA family outer membrane protein [Gammaproteobacteria bacterium]|nr:BamA/TamA family outer membrane protein [Xanthomonadales bacterium]MCB1594554.1 BamA/TamA family outer membrane protein [Xanthomonadales bacterium]HOP21697.1 BamA/TamA family outer membrane protein [Gammaproteobacteria bacterium]HPI95596.1 BamA/TamA family outer membrane protein [Gammaproteobacteria bacterium]HPQ86821.1 BamA/TamA family outer membrane protein [Gammaproteobacteria bacterium]